MRIVSLNFCCKCSKTDAAKNNTSTELVNKVAADSIAADSLVQPPTCVKALIGKRKAEPVTNPPGKLYSYTYASKKVYYVPPVCCDNFSDLYNDSCKIITHPDGGFTGRGVRKIKNFEEKNTNEKLLWQDK